MKRKILFIVSLVMIFIVGFSSFSQEKPNLENILKNFDAAQSRINTMTADFVQHKTLLLLAEPTESKGYFYFKKPDKFLWKYTDPTESYLAINGDSLTTYYPEFKSADKVNIKRYRKRIMKYLGIGQSVEVLNDIFDIELVSNNKLKNTYLLSFDPTKKRVEKRLKLIRMWIDIKSFLPIQAEYTEGNGDITVFTFSNLKLDEELEDNIFNIDIPDDVKINHSSDNLFPR